MALTCCKCISEADARCLWENQNILAMDVKLENTIFFCCFPIFVVVIWGGIYVLLHQVLEGVIKYRWNALPVEQRDGMKNYISEVIVQV